MARRVKLSRTMTVAEFDNGYWYAKELQDFAEALGAPSAKKLRKDEIERALRSFLTTGKLEVQTKRALGRSGTPDSLEGLALDRPVRCYTNDRATKDFIVREAKKRSPSFKERSGWRYRLNRWREAQIVKGVSLTYGDLVKECVALNEQSTVFKRIPHGRYINFVADFLRKEKGATRVDAIAAWSRLKKMDVPKDYPSWRKQARG
jgi:hypothetical protein